MAAALCKELEKCVLKLEGDVRQSLQEIDGANTPDEILENRKDHHYKEILGHLVQIKDHIKLIAEHDKSLHNLEKRGSKIDKDYIKKQVETFQSMGAVNRRVHKPIRPRETSTLKMLETWEKMIEEQGNGDIPYVRRRANSLRKEKKVVSSTVDTLLESSPARKCASLESLLEDRTVEAVNARIAFKPRIVDVIYKKKLT